MNTVCRFVFCDDATLRGRTHCEKHREVRLSELERRYQEAKQQVEQAIHDYLTYVDEGHGS